MCCGYSLESAFCWVPQHLFSKRNKKIPLFFACQKKKKKKKKKKKNKKRKEKKKKNKVFSGDVENGSCVCVEDMSPYPLRKHAYPNILKILPSKNENFQMKISCSFHISAQNIDCGYPLETPRRGLNRIEIWDIQGQVWLRFLIYKYIFFVSEWMLYGVRLSNCFVRMLDCGKRILDWCTDVTLVYDC